MCVYYTFHPRVLNYFTNWLCKVPTWEPLCSSEKCSQSTDRSTGPARFPESLGTKLWALGRQSRGRKWDLEMTFSLMFLCLCPVSAEQLFDCVRDAHLHAVSVKQTTSAGTDAILGVNPSLCTAIRGLSLILKHAEHLKFTWIQQKQP